MDVNIYKTKDNSEGRLFAGISGAALAFTLESGGGDNFPQPYFGATTSAGDSTTLNATGVGSSGIAVGDFILNETDGSHAFVLAVNTDSLTTTELQGGSDNTWENGDTYRVNSFVITFNTRDSSNNITAQEQAYVIARSGDTFTIESGGRGFAGTTPQEWAASATYINLFVISSLQTQITKALADLARQIDLKASSAAVSAALNVRNWKDPVIAASVANLNLTTDVEDGDSLDDVPLSTGDRILIKDQTDASENGIYIVAASGAPARAADFDESGEIGSAVIAVKKGTSNADALYICTTDDPIIDTDDIDFIILQAALVKASQAEAEAGINDTKYMTPLKVAQAIEALQNITDAQAGILTGGSSSYAETLHTHSQSNLGTTYRNASDASGNEIISHGLSAVPKMILFFAVGATNTNTSSNGAVDDDGHNSCSYSSPASFGVLGIRCIYCADAAGNVQYGQVTNRNSTSFTITWTKVGSGNPAHVTWIAFT